MIMASTTKNDELQNNYLRVILEELRSLRTEVKKLESDLKDLKKHVTNLHHSPPIS